MAKRKKAEPPPKKKKPPAPKPLHAGDDHVDGMDPPCHNMPLTVHELTPYPLMRATIESKGGDGYVHAFVDEEYGLGYIYYSDRPKLAPTWMDPEMFAKMCQADSKIVDILAKCFKANSRTMGDKLLPPELDRIMEEQYLPYVLENFERVKWIFAQWLVRNYAQVIQDWQREKKEKKQPRRARQENET